MRGSRLSVNLAEHQDAKQGPQPSPGSSRNMQLSAAVTLCSGLLAVLCSVTLPGSTLAFAPPLVLRPAPRVLRASRRSRQAIEGALVLQSSRGGGGDLADLQLDEKDLDVGEKARLESLRSISTSLNEVDEIAKRLGYEENDDDEEEDEVDLEIEDTQWSGQAGLDVTRTGESSWVDLNYRKGLALGDFLAISLFAYIGRTSHGGGGGVLDIQLLKTALPFLGGWFALAPVLGAYTNDATATQGDMAKTLAKSWALSIPVGIAIRAAAKGEVPPLPFVGVTMLSTLLILGAWRALYVAVNPTSTAEFKKGGVLDGFRMITTLLGRW